MENKELPEVENGCQAIITNIKYGGKVLNEKIKERPDFAVLDIPEGIWKTIDNKKKFEDNVESLCYNTLTRKYGKEVTFCQIWLP